MNGIDFSVVIPAYNASSFINRAIQSVRAQKVESWEIIIVENGSTDDTFDKCKAMEDCNIHVYQSEKGVSNARNLGIMKAQGDWLIFLDADDELILGAFESVKEDLTLNMDFISYRYEHNEISREKQIYNSKERISLYMEQCLKDPTQRCNSTAVVFNRGFISSNKISFDSRLSHAEDSVFLISCIENATFIKDCSIPIYRVIPNDNSAVRSMSDSTITSYCNSIRAIDKLLLNRNTRIANAYNVFVLSQLLVILVNGPYKSDSFISAVKKTKDLCSGEIFGEATKAVEVSGLPLLRKITMLLLKLKLYVLVGVIIKLRVFMKHKNR